MKNETERRALLESIFGQSYEDIDPEAMRIIEEASEETTTAPGFTDRDWQKLIAFQGYGNPAGKFWFIGIEERGDGIPQELEVKLKYREIEDLLYSQSPAVWGHSPHWSDFDPRKLIPTWTTMIKIVLRLDGDPNWSDAETIRAYQLDKFGKLDGDAFITELLPLAKKGDSDWPSWWPWPSWQEYAEAVLPERIVRLRNSFDTHQPRFVFGYGRSYWNYFRQVFPDAQFRDILDGKMQVARIGSSTITLTPFFARFLMTAPLIDSMVTEIETP